MPVTTRSGLQTATEDTPDVDDEAQDRDQEDQELPRKRRRTSRRLQERDPESEPDAATSLQSPNRRGALGQSYRPGATGAEEGNPSGETPSHAEESPPQNTGRHRTRGIFRGAGRRLGSGMRVTTTSGYMSVTDRPPTPYPRDQAVPHTLEEESTDDWKPPIVIGRSLGENLSRAETARRTVAQWEAVYERTLRDTPAAVGPILEQVELVRRERDELELNEENDTPVYNLESTRHEAVQARLDTLRWALSTSRSLPETTNILAAIEAYKSSTIRYWHRWTLFWNGQVVDFCPSYESFCADRAERLDQYARDHGPGWLWYEAPLADDSTRETHSRAMRATFSVQNRNQWNMGSWNITMGFRRVKSYVSRDQGVPGWDGKLPREPILKAARTRPPRGPAAGPGSPIETRTGFTVADDPSAPKVHFDVLLDSGATFPLLYERDFNALGIDLESYPAQTATAVATVDSRFDARLYELRTTICSADGLSLVDPKRPAWPNQPHDVGAVVPVAVLPPPRPGAGPSSHPPPPGPVELRGGRRKAPRPNAGVPGQRLSGLLPFLACYVTVAPGCELVWLGEGRRDVLGAMKFPGKKRLGAKVDTHDVARLRMKAWSSPDVRLEHPISGGLRLVDKETARDPFGNELRVVDGEGRVVEQHRVEPKRGKGVHWRKSLVREKGV